MSIDLLSRHLFLAALLSVIPLAAACGGKAVIDGASGGSSGGGNGTGGSGAGSPMAYDGIVTAEGPVTIRLASFGRSCANPTPTVPTCDYWVVRATMPASMLAPGTIGLDPPEVDL